MPGWNQVCGWLLGLSAAICAAVILATAPSLGTTMRPMGDKSAAAPQLPAGASDDEWGDPDYSVSEESARPEDPRAFARSFAAAFVGTNNGSPAAKVTERIKTPQNLHLVPPPSTVDQFVDAEGDENTDIEIDPPPLGKAHLANLLFQQQDVSKPVKGPLQVKINQRKDPDQADKTLTTTNIVIPAGGIPPVESALIMDIVPAIKPKQKLVPQRAVIHNVTKHTAEVKTTEPLLVQLTNIGPATAGEVKVHLDQAVGATTRNLTIHETVQPSVGTFDQKTGNWDIPSVASGTTVTAKVDVKPAGRSASATLDAHIVKEATPNVTDTPGSPPIATTATATAAVLGVTTRKSFSTLAAPGPKRLTITLTSTKPVAQRVRLFVARSNGRTLLMKVDPKFRVRHPFHLTLSRSIIRKIPRSAKSLGLQVTGVAADESVTTKEALIRVR